MSCIAVNTPYVDLERLEEGNYHNMMNQLLSVQPPMELPSMDDDAESDDGLEHVYVEYVAALLEDDDDDDDGPIEDTEDDISSVTFGQYNSDYDYDYDDDSDVDDEEYIQYVRDINTIIYGCTSP